MRIYPSFLGMLLAAVLATVGCSPSDQDAALAAIQAAGGSVSYDKQGRIISVDLSDSAATDAELVAVGVLPDVQTINCTNSPGIKGPGLAALGVLPNLETLYLVGTGVDDEGLVNLQVIRSLKTLHLGRTQVTDAGMVSIDHLADLQTLSLGNTEVTDAGLIELRDLRKLSTVILRHTKTTPRGVQELRRMLPNTRIED